MYGIRAYAEAGNSQGFFPAHSKSALSRNGFTEFIKTSGDSVRLSEQALELIQNEKGGISNCPQDATYDQYGNINRQFYAVQKDLHDLTASVWPVNAALASQLTSLNNQMYSLQMQV